MAMPEIRLETGTAASLSSAMKVRIILEASL